MSKKVTGSKFMARCTEVLIPLCAMILLNCVVCSAGTLEARVSRKIIQLYVETMFPVEAKGDELIGGREKTPTFTRLSNPRVMCISNESSERKPIILVDMDYEVTEMIGGKCIEKGRVTEKMYVAVSEDHAYLTISPGDKSIVLPSVSLHIKQPGNSVKIPLLKDYGLKQMEKLGKIHFRDVRLTVEGDELVIKSAVAFEQGR